MADERQRRPAESQPDEGVFETSSDPRFPLPEQQPTRGPVDYAEVPEQPGAPPGLGDPTRRRHPTILSEEGEEEAPLTELPHESEP